MTPPAQAVLWFWTVFGTVMGVLLPLLLVVVLLVIVVKGFRLDQDKERKRRERIGNAN